MTWTFQPASRSFEQERSAWDSINALRGNHILLDSGFVSPLLRHFTNGMVTLGINSDPARAGMVLLTSCGVGRWESFQPSQAPIGMFLFAQPDTSGEKLRGMMKKLPGYAVHLSVLQQDPDYSSVPLVESRPGLERIDYIETARIAMAGTFEEYWKRRGSNLRHNLSRRRRRMTEKGYAVELVARRSAAEVKDAIREYGRLESTGWKAKDSTAVSVDNAQGRFYRDVFEHFCERGEAVIYQLVLDGNVVASDLCLVRGGMMIVLKTAYDEAFNEYSPALLMREDIMRFLFAERTVKLVEFYGRVMDWHRRWTEEVRVLYHLNCYRYQWLAPLKKLVRRLG